MYVVYRFTLLHVDIQLSLQRLLKRLSFLQCVCLTPLSKIFWILKLCGFLLISPFYFICLGIIFMSILYCFNLSGFVVQVLKSGSVMCPALLFFLLKMALALAIWGCFWFDTNFMWLLYLLLWIMSFVFWWRLFCIYKPLWVVWTFSQYWLFHEWDAFPSLCVRCNFFHQSLSFPLKRSFTCLVKFLSILCSYWKWQWFLDFLFK